MTALGAFVRLHDAGQSLWLDELHTAWTAAGSFGDVIPRARLGHQSPVFFVVEWCSVQIFGLNEWGVRLPSLAAGIALIPIAAVIVARWSGSLAAGVLVAALVAGDYFCVFYAQEARPYAILQLLALLHVAVFFELCRRPTWKLRLAFIIGGALLFHLHYTTTLLLIGEMAYYGLAIARKNRRMAYRPATLLADLVGMACGMAPAFPWVWDTAANRGNWTSFVPIPKPQDLLFVFPITAYLILPLSVALALQSIRKRWKTAGQPLNVAALCLIACWFVAPLLIAWVCTTFDVARVFYRRYLMICAVAPLLASTVIWPRFATLPRVAFVVVLAVLTQTSLGQLLPAGFAPPPAPMLNYLRTGAFTSHAREDWRGAVEIVRSTRDADHLPVYVRSGLIETADLTENSDEGLRQYSLLPVTGIYSLAQPSRPLSPLPPADRVRLTPAQLDLIADHHGGWLILRGNALMDPVVRDVVRDLAARKATAKLTRRWNLRGVTVMRFAVEPMSGDEVRQ